MKIRPKFSDQKESFKAPCFHGRPGFKARRQNRVRPSPSIPYTPNNAVWPWTRREVETLNVIEGDGWVDEETEQSGSHHVPECDRHEEIDRPLVIRNPWRLLCWLRETKVIPCLITNQRQRHYLKRAEDRSEADYRWAWHQRSKGDGTSR